MIDKGRIRKPMIKRSFLFLMLLALILSACASG
jgi:hypothetical protein